MIPRIQFAELEEKLKSSKILLLKGPRNAGILDLLASVLHKNSWKAERYSGLNKAHIESWQEEALPSADGLVIFEEAQYFPNLQQIVEKVLAGELTCTAVFCCSFEPDLDEMLVEALRIEGMEFNVFAPSFFEAAQHFGLPKEEELLESRLIYGNYPQVLSDMDQAEETLKALIDEIVFTKLGANDRINKGQKLMRVMQLIAFQIGDTVSYNELGERAGLDNETVERYVELLEQAFLLIRLPAYHTNQRYELKKSNAIYFTDNGIRNALIQNFNPTFLRNDMDVLWRNYVVSERVKWMKMNRIHNETYLWKTHTKQRMDFVEINGDKIKAYKTDWEKRKRVKIPKSFTDAYPKARTTVLNRSTYWSFLSSKN